MCCGGDMPNLVERMPLGGEPGCCEAATGGIKLFGQTISVTQPSFGENQALLQMKTSRTGAGADAEVRLRASPVADAALTFRQEWTEKKGVVENPISARSSSGDGYLQPPKFGKLATTECGTPNVGSRLSDDSSEGGHSDELKEQSEGDHSHSVGNDKNLPKPDKVVACPRCDSWDTKFCYYNNYNVNQPRHFCKNCQRYWTAGGTLRNVPVGAGRRKNKHGGGNQRESCADASASTLFSGPPGSPTSQKGTSFKQSQQKRMAGQSSPMRSPGSVCSFGQESGITMSSPSYSLPLQQNGRLAFEPYASSQGFMTAGAEASAVGSSDTASTLHQRLQPFPSGHGFDRDCSRSSLSVLMPEEFPVAYRPVASSDMTCFNGEYPNGYHLEWTGKQHSLASPNGCASFSTPGRSSYNPTGSTTPAWNPYVSHPQMAAREWCGAGLSISPAGQEQQPHTSLGKRAAPDGGSQMPTKTLRTDDFSRRFKSTWPMLGRNPSDVSATLKLKSTWPKLELAGACEQKDSFRGRLYLDSAAARPGPHPVTI